MKHYIGFISLIVFGVLSCIYGLFLFLGNITYTGSIGSFIVNHLDVSLLASGIIAFGIFASDIFERRKSDNFLLHGSLILFGLAVFLGYMFFSNV